MLSLAILWTVLFVALTATGLPILHYCGLHNSLKRTEDRIFAAIWLSLLVLANVLLLASLATNLTLLTAIFILAAMMAPYLYKADEYLKLLRGFSADWGGALALILATAAALAITATSTDAVEDTGLYHHQTIEWLSQYGSVKGLALLHDRFGYAVSWFALIAPLQTGWLYNHFLNGMNGFIFWLMSLQAILILRRVAHANAALPDWFFLLAFAMFCQWFFAILILSPSPDLPVTFLVLVTAWLTLAIAGAERKPGQKRGAAALLILAAGCVSIKIGAVPLLAAAGVVYLWTEGLNARNVGTAAALSLPFIAIHAAVAVTTSGCPLYPSPLLCTDLPWSVGEQSARQASSIALEFLQWNAPAPPDATRFNWLWHAPPANNIFNDKALMKNLLIANLPCALWLFARWRKIGREASACIAGYALTGIAFTLVMLPHLRFGLAFFVLLPALAGADLLLALSTAPYRIVALANRARTPLLVIAALLAVMPMGRHFREQYLDGQSGEPFSVIAKYLSVQPGMLIWPRPAMMSAIPPQPGMRQIIQMGVQRSNNFEYHYPVYPGNNGLCWGASLPCTPVPLNANNIWLRNEAEGLSGGFEKR
jgi:hypothetical protein